MWLTGLADVARNAGLDVREAQGWQNRGHGEMTDVRTITCHHTGSSGPNDMSLTLLIAGRPDLSGPIANLGVGRSGRVYVVAAGVAWHAGQSRDPSYTNHHAIGIEAQNSGAEPWPQRQMDAYMRLCRALADHYRVPYSRVLGHKETCAPPGRKVDPSFDMRAFRARLTTLEDTMAKLDKDDLAAIGQLIDDRMDEIARSVWRYKNPAVTSDDAYQRQTDIFKATSLLKDRLTGPGK